MGKKCEIFTLVWTHGDVFFGPINVPKVLPFGLVLPDVFGIDPSLRYQFPIRTIIQFVEDTYQSADPVLTFV